MYKYLFFPIKKKHYKKIIFLKNIIFISFLFIVYPYLIFRKNIHASEWVQNALFIVFLILSYSCVNMIGTRFKDTLFFIIIEVVTFDIFLPAIIWVTILVVMVLINM